MHATDKILHNKEFEYGLHKEAASRILTFIELPPPVRLCISRSIYAGFSTCGAEYLTCI